MRQFLAGASVLVAGAMLFAATPAAAQNVISWVSGVGADANPCSRTAPCLTFNGALAKTNSGGQINCIDDGNYGAVTITTSLTIDCDKGSIIASAGTAVTVNILSTAVVYLRGIRIDGVSANTSSAVTIVGGGKVYLDNVSVRNFLGDGVVATPNAATQLYITDSTISNNRNSAAGGGLLVVPAANVTTSIVVTGSMFEGNSSAGIRLKTAGTTTSAIALKVRDSTISGNANGIIVTAPAGAGTIAVGVQDSELARNTTYGVVVNGVRGQAVVTNTTITGNAAGVLGTASGTVVSTGDNAVYGNSNNGFFTSTVTKQ
jgi:hypothetical protein